MPDTSVTEGTVSNDILSSVIIPAPADSTDTAKTADTSEAKAKSADTNADDSSPKEKLPQRLRGVSTFEEAVSKFKELESEFGRKNNEIGQLRYVVDELLQLKKSQDLGAEAKAKAHTPVTTDSLLAEPDKAISSVVERTVNEKASATENRLARMEYEAAKGVFVAAFPDYQETQANPEFIEWVKASPYRMKLAQTMVQGGSFDAAAELFGMHKELSEAKAAATLKADTKGAAAAALSRPGNGNTTGGARKERAPGAANAGKEILSRVELGKLYANNRDAYNAMGAEIRKAYAEGRVR